MTDNNQPEPHMKRVDPLAPNTPTPRRSVSQRLLAAGIILGIILLVFIAIKVIVAGKPSIRQGKPERTKVTVETLKVSRSAHNITLEALGTVIAAQSLALKPSVSGTVEYVASTLVPGGMISKGDVVLKLDKREYQLAYERSKNNYAQAAMDLRIELGSQAVARREFQMLQELITEEINDAPQELALREPQLAQAKAAQAAAKNQMELAALDLDRTTLYCPFNAVVLEKQVDIGAQVSNQTTVATLAGTDTFWVRVAVPQDQLLKIRLPGNDQPGSPVDILRLNDDDTAPARQGKIIKLLREVDEKGLMARLLIAIDRPTKAFPGAPPLLLGSVVKARIAGISLPPSFQIPRIALKENNSVFVCTDNSTLAIRQVEIIWQNDNIVFINKGLQEGDQVITSAIGAPIEGMELNPRLL